MSVYSFNLCVEKKYICTVNISSHYTASGPSTRSCLEYFFNHWTWCCLVALVFQAYAQKPHFITALFSSLIYIASLRTASVASWGQIQSNKEVRGMKKGNVLLEMQCVESLSHFQENDNRSCSSVQEIVNVFFIVFNQTLWFCFPSRTDKPPRGRSVVNVWHSHWLCSKIQNMVKSALVEADESQHSSFPAAAPL